MPDRDLKHMQLERLRQWRNRPARDQSMAFITKQFKQEIERPYKQVSAIVDTWAQLVPAELAEHCRLQSLRRSVLRVAVDSSEHLYQLDRLLRQGLADQITRQHPAAGVRRIQLYLDARL
jgi:hypothetical protein